jgi:hypothetical protein
VVPPHDAPRRVIFYWIAVISAVGAGFVEGLEVVTSHTFYGPAAGTEPFPPCRASGATPLTLTAVQVWAFGLASAGEVPDVVITIVATTVTRLYASWSSASFHDYSLTHNQHSAWLLAGS